MKIKLTNLLQKFFGFSLKKNRHSLTHGSKNATIAVGTIEQQ